MSIRPFRDIKRRKTKVISVGKVKVGGDNPISVQSMTNTLTTDIKKTVDQINKISITESRVLINGPSGSEKSWLQERFIKNQKEIISLLLF